MSSRTPRPIYDRGNIGRKAWVDFAKGAAILMVVYYHSALYLSHVGVGGTVGVLKAVGELYAMPVFFLIAGLMNFRTSTWTFGQTWRRRLWPILYIYILWSVIRAVFYLVVPGINGELGELSATNPLSLALILVWPSSSYWFMYALFLFTLLAWLLRRVPRWLQVGGLAIVSTLVTSGLLSAQNIGWNRILALAVFFVAGTVYAKQVNALIDRAGSVALLAAILAFVISCGALVVLHLRFVPLVVLAGQVSAVAVGIFASKYLVRLRPLRFVSPLGKQSLQIYLFHLYIIVPVTGLIGLLYPDWPRPVNVLVQFAVVAFTVLMSLLLARLTQRARWLLVPPSLPRASARSSDPSGDVRKAARDRT